MGGDFNAARASFALTVDVLDLVTEERARQNEKWGIQNHEPCVWMNILIEEVGEVGKEVLGMLFSNMGTGDLDFHHDRYIVELTHVAAVAVAMIERELRRSEEER